MLPRDTENITRVVRTPRKPPHKKSLTHNIPNETLKYAFARSSRAYLRAAGEADPSHRRPTRSDRRRNLLCSVEEGIVHAVKKSAQQGPELSSHRVCVFLFRFPRVGLLYVCPFLSGAQWVAWFYRKLDDFAGKVDCDFLEDMSQDRWWCGKHDKSMVTFEEKRGAIETTQGKRMSKIRKMN